MRFKIELEAQVRQLTTAAARMLGESPRLSLGFLAAAPYAIVTSLLR